MLDHCHNTNMKYETGKDIFETFLKEKSELYFKDNNLLSDAIKYSLLAPGKRIRPLLCIGFSQGFSGNTNHALLCGVSVEMIHAYSLIHDDLPSMDNDDYRRGRLTNHKVYGEATAILAGDSLLNFAPEFLLKELTQQGMDARKVIEITTLLLESSGHRGMVDGQALDMKFEAEVLTTYQAGELQNILKNIHNKKTGAIISWSCLAGLYSSTDDQLIRKNSAAVKAIGNDIGLLFQMVDDIIDVTSSLEDLGKTPGKDANSGKLTYTSLHGLNGAIETANDLVHEILKNMANLNQSEGNWEIVHAIILGLKNRISN